MAVYPSAPEGPSAAAPDITQLTRMTLGVAPSTLSQETRDFLRDVLVLHGSTMEAALWLTSKNEGFGGIPVSRIQNGEIADLRRQWNAFSGDERMSA